MLNWTQKLTLAAALTVGLSPLATFAQQADAPAAEAAVDQATGTVTGKIVLPDEVPDWFHGGKLDPSSAVVVLEGRFERPPVPFPDGYKEMSREEKAAWQNEFMQSEAYKEYMAKMAEAYNNRPRIEVKVNADGSFKAENLKPDTYMVTAAIPHANADKSRLAYHSWASSSGKLQVLANGNTDLGDMEMELMNIVMPGDTAPEWTAKTYDGKQIKLSDYRGKFVLLDFWATWCGPCKAEIPNLEAVYKDFGGEKFEMVGLSLDSEIDKPRQFHEEHHSPYVHGYLGEWNKTETTARDYGVIGIPSIWLIGPDGKVVARDLRGEKLREAVRQAVQGQESQALAN